MVAQSRPAFEALGLVDSGRGSGGGRALVAETAREEKSRIIRRKTIALGKAFAPHPTSGAPCLMRRLCVLSCLPKFLPIEITTHLTALFWVELRIRQHKAAIHYQRLPGGVICAL